MTAGMIGGILGTVVGLAGGVAGTYFSVKNADGPVERRLIYKFAVAIWVAICLFLIGLFLLPVPYNHLLWIPYGLTLSMAIKRYNQTLTKMRNQDSQVPT
ncbi:MAG: hypothetical protein KDB03_27120 [Planctomycetales bacterium]|nr:hypothetical protein [Planctomycetales bacterium]